MTTFRPRRRGLSLTEVLIAMFLMAVGMIAIFTLFPLGAMQVGQALRDDRTSQMALQADGYMRSVWRSDVVNQPELSRDQEFYTKMNPAGGSLAGPSIAVVVDPVARASGAPAYVANGTAPNQLDRVQFKGVTSAPAALAIGGMTDDVLFESNGSPTAKGTLTGNSAAPLNRQGRYTWAALLQRPAGAPREVADLAVLAFDGRARLLSVNGTGAYSDEYMVGAAVTAGSRQVDVTVPARSPDDPVLVRTGGWVLDATAGRKAVFYRIVAANESAATPGQFTLDLETPFPADQTGTARLFFFAGLAEVFVRPQLKPDPAN